MLALITTLNLNPKPTPYPYTLTLNPVRGRVVGAGGMLGAGARSMEGRGSAASRPRAGVLCWVGRWLRVVSVLQLSYHSGRGLVEGNVFSCRAR